MSLRCLLFTFLIVTTSLCGAATHTDIAAAAGIASTSGHLAVYQNDLATTPTATPTPAPASPQYAYIYATELRDMIYLGEPVSIFDVRSETDYAKGHVMTAILRPYSDGTFASAPPELPLDRPIVTYCAPACAMSHHAAELLLAWGFTEVYMLHNGYAGWVAMESPPINTPTPTATPTPTPDDSATTPTATSTATPTESPGYSYIYATELQEMIQSGSGVFIFDVRSETAYAQGHIMQAVLRPYADGTFASAPPEIPLDYPIVTYCAMACTEGERAAEILLAWGFTEVYVLHNGYEAWLAMEGPPTDTPTPTATDEPTTATTTPSETATPTATPTPTPAVDPVESEIERFYWSVLGRAPEPNAVEAWRDGYFYYVMQHNVDVRLIFREMGRLFFFSDEYAARNRTDEEFISDCYVAFLCREPLWSEVNGWIGGVWTRPEAMTIISKSDEYAQYAESLLPGYSGSLARNYVTTLYIGLLDRLVDPDGLEYFTERLECAGAPLAEARQMARDLIASEEFQTNFPTVEEQVVRYYRGILGRFPNTTEVTYWTEQITSGKMNANQVVNLFLISAEYYVIFVGG